MPLKVDDELPTMVAPAEPTATDGSWKKRKPSKVPEVGALRLAVSLPVRVDRRVCVSCGARVIEGHSSPCQASSCR